MRKYLIFTLSIFLISFIFGACSQGQVDVNSASLQELDNLYGIGPVKAQAIIDSRIYNDLDDLINAKGIGEVTLENIKSQGLACIKEETIDNSESEEENSTLEEEAQETEEEQEETEEQEEMKVEREESTAVFEKEEEPLKAEIIHLNPKTIKTKNSNEEVSKISYSKYLIILFCIILIALYLKQSKNEKRKKEKRKTEWR